jgi:hypothetical protein
MSPVGGATPDGDRVLSGADPRGWRDTLTSICAKAPQLLRYATDPREGDALMLLPDIEPSRALFLGNALAILPFMMASLFEVVVAADWNASRLAFARRRRDEEEVANLTCIPADAVEDLTRRDGPFDVVVLGEDCPEGHTSVPVDGPWTPSRLASLLVAGGCLMYGVRFRLGDVLAQRLASPRKRRAPTFYPAHARLLAAARLAPAAVYWRRPDLRPYQAYIPLDRPSIVRYWREQAPLPRRAHERLNAVLTTAASRTDLLHRLADNFLVVARRP